MTIPPPPAHAPLGHERDRGQQKIEAAPDRRNAPDPALGGNPAPGAARARWTSLGLDPREGDG
jgi:hypothetical protein